VLLETVFGIAGGGFDHEPVARDFRQNGSGGDAVRTAIAFDQSLLRGGEIPHGQPVDEGEVGIRETLDGAPHAGVGGSENVEPVDLRRIDHGDRPFNPDVAGQGFVELLAGGGGEFLGIVELLERKRFAENDRGDNHGAGQRSAPRLVDAGDSKVALRAPVRFPRPITRHGAGS